MSATVRRTQLTVREGGENILVYNFRSVSEATEIFEFIREYFPDAEFVMEVGEEIPARLH